MFLTSLWSFGSKELGRIEIDEEADVRAFDGVSLNTHCWLCAGESPWAHCGNRR
jgi:hypothetical protein